MKGQTARSEQKGCCLVKNFGRKAFFYISSPTTPTVGTKKNWLLVIDDSTSYVQSFFLKETSNLADIIVGLIKNLKNEYNLQVQYLCCNNTGENIAFKKACKQEGLGVEFKFTARGMSQQNGCIERKFATLFNWVYAMLNSGKLITYLQHG